MSRFPEGFLWGTGASSFQTEGNITNNNWYFSTRDDLQHPAPQRRFTEPAGLATDFWNRYETDFDLASEIGVQMHRLSVEWSRVFPAPGRVDHGALSHYREILESLRKRGIKVVLTAQHFSIPDWVDRNGAFLNQEYIVRHFREYVRVVSSELGDLVDYWIPVNEPTEIVLGGYYVAAHPPFERSAAKAIRAFRTLISMHATAYHAIKEHWPEKPVGSANSWFHHTPYDPASAFDRRVAAYNMRAVNHSFFKAVTTGRLPFPAGLNTAVPEVKDTLDFVGLNYYSRIYARGLKTVWNKPGDRICDLGWHVYPQGLYEALAWLRDNVGLPVIITENGVATTDESFRIEYVSLHLRQLLKAIENGVPVKGYTHWSLTDNWEMTHGFESRFGLVHVDYETQEREIKDSGRWYAGVIQRNALED